ncbi:MAG TPA: signal peptidase II [Bryobacteraceae bacterium]|nr:signal peptidase II [Bryobacteraceae bacterium]
MSTRVAAMAVAAAVFILDRLTKLWIEANVPLHGGFSVIPGFFDIVHARNRGAAFGMLAETEGLLRPLLLVGVSMAVLVLIAVALLKQAPDGEAPTRVTMAGLSLVFGGALGNVYDRVVRGEVTDFLEFYQGEWRFAAFNVADSAITTGAALLILDMWRTRHRHSNHVS